MQTDDIDVGNRLKELRIGAGLSQRALAQRAGVPHGQISLVETNKVSPSVATMRKILGGIPISLSEFFEPQRLSTDEVFFTDDELIDLTSRLTPHQTRGIKQISFRQVGDARRHNLQILHETYAPGAETGTTMLEHPGHEGGVVVSGELEVTVGSRRRILKAGDSFLFESRVPHRYRNIGTEDAIVISACTPPYL